MPKPVVIAFILAGTVPGSLAAQGITVEHAALGCVVAEQFPRLEARIDPADAVARALVHFRTDAARPWYAVAMKAEGGAFSAVLPKPKKSLESFQYYIDATDRAFATSRTPEHTAQVVGSGAECKGKMMGSALASVATILLEVPAGAPLVPAGFGSAGVAAAGSSTAAAATAGAASGGGLGAGAVAAIVGGGAAVAGAAIAVSAAGGDDDSGGGDSGGNQPVVYSVLFPLPGLDVSACAGRRLTWTSQTVVPDANGRFDTTWAPSEPNTLRVNGTVTNTAFNAAIACTSGSPTGSIAATGGGGTYQGTVTFGSQQGTVTVTRQ